MIAMAFNIRPKIIELFFVIYFIILLVSYYCSAYFGATTCAQSHRHHYHQGQLYEPLFLIPLRWGEGIKGAVDEDVEGDVDVDGAPHGGLGHGGSSRWVALLRHQNGAS